jgi:hypothetical protein
MVLRIRHGLERFFQILDSEGVGLFQAIVYIHLAVGGFYCAAIAGGVPQVVEEAMGPAINVVWLWMCMGVLLCLAGKLMKGPLAYIGLVLQVAGDAFALGGFGSYVLATMQTEYWGKTLIAVWVFAALADCALLLVIRDVRRIAQVEQRVRR